MFVNAFHAPDADDANQRTARMGTLGDELRSTMHDVTELTGHARQRARERIATSRECVADARKTVMDTKEEGV